MRLSRAVFLLAALVPAVALAAGNVLLPSAPGGSSSYPNLGLGVAPPASSGDTTAPAPQAAPADAPAPPPQQAAPAASPPAPQAGMSTPAQQVTIRQLKGDTSHLPRGAIPTQIISVPDNSAALAAAGRNLPYGLTVAVGGESVFGAKDVEAIRDKLGLSREQIGANCLLTLRGLVQTTKGGSIIDGGASPRIQVRYDGMIKGYVLAGQAWCRADRLPLGSGFLTETDGRFGVPLQSVSCPAPTRQVTQLTVTYTGDDKSRCSYQ